MSISYPHPSAPAVDMFVDPERIASDVATNALELESELSRQSGLVYFYTSMAARAERQHSVLKLRLEAQEADAATKVRTAAASATPPEKLTADMVKERVRLTPECVKLEKALIFAREVESVLKGVVQALRDKSSSLTSLTNLTRDEIRAKLQVEEDLRAASNTGTTSRDRQMKDRLRAAS